MKKPGGLGLKKLGLIETSAGRLEQSRGEAAAAPGEASTRQSLASVLEPWGELRYGCCAELWPEPALCRNMVEKVCLVICMPGIDVILRQCCGAAWPDRQNVTWLIPQTKDS